jgi:hypothetical protein
MKDVMTLTASFIAVTWVGWASVVWLHKGWVRATVLVCLAFLSWQFYLQIEERIGWPGRAALTDAAFFDFIVDEPRAIYLWLAEEPPRAVMVPYTQALHKKLEEQKPAIAMAHGGAHIRKCLGCDGWEIDYPPMEMPSKDDQ